jgi:hypothetical protein
MDFSSSGQIVEGLRGPDDAKAFDVGEVPSVKSSELASAFDRGCSDNQVNHSADSVQAGPDAGVFVSSVLGVGNNRH